MIERCAPALPDRTVHTLSLIVTELVTNSLRHASGGQASITVTLEAKKDAVTVAVADEGPGFEPEDLSPETPPRGSALADIAGLHEGGRGLVIVGQLCDRWGVDKDEHFKVWCEIASPA